MNDPASSPLYTHNPLTSLSLTLTLSVRASPLENAPAINYLNLPEIMSRVRLENMPAGIVINLAGGRVTNEELGIVNRARAYDLTVAVPIRTSVVRVQA